MRLVKIALLIAVTLLFNSYVAKAQGNSNDLWEFNCRKFEERAWTQCSTSSFSLERRYLITNSKTTEVGRISLINRSNKYRALEFLGFTPSHGAEDVSKNWWFFGPKAGRLFYAKPGRKSNIHIYFVGCRATRPAGHSGSLCVDEGTYEGTFKLRDKISGTEYEFTITVYAVKPKSKN